MPDRAIYQSFPEEARLTAENNRRDRSSLLAATCVLGSDLFDLPLPIIGWEWECHDSFCERVSYGFAAYQFIQQIQVRRLVFQLWPFSFSASSGAR
ncbi:hypothetical protein [Roseibacillus ishigakijimensis]|uniref:Uncharacterized protein n=1 Tax=Roseibacillus ishigakijimensis TaxID=454146 RepID=A0A934VKT7_9BACT|nr:hypothetical protein [Roseibacillus ishigakijimensis]MBK1832426.1 hypothetical protein [Roseibacillus ishigakijimensis]